MSAKPAASPATNPTPLPDGAPANKLNANSTIKGA
jgi:hypothetical protein